MPRKLSSARILTLLLASLACFATNADAQVRPKVLSYCAEPRKTMIFIRNRFF